MNKKRNRRSLFKPSTDEINKYARQYDKCATLQDKEIEKEMKALLLIQRWICKHELIKIAQWKARGRIDYLCDKNTPEEVKEISRKALAANTDRDRMETLRELDGVDYPMASVILHFAFPNKYPILDRRAIWSLHSWLLHSEKPPSIYSFKCWKEYCGKILCISKSTGCTIREIDKALWQYSKEKQRKGCSRHVRTREAG